MQLVGTGRQVSCYGRRGGAAAPKPRRASQPQACGAADIRHTGRRPQPTAAAGKYRTNPISLLLLLLPPLPPLRHTWPSASSAGWIRPASVCTLYCRGWLPSTSAGQEQADGACRWLNAHATHHVESAAQPAGHVLTATRPPAACAMMHCCLSSAHTSTATIPAQPGCARMPAAHPPRSARGSGCRCRTSRARCRPS